MRLAICVATMTECDDQMHDLRTWHECASLDIPVYVQRNTRDLNLGIVGSYDKLYRQSTEDILMFIHDDVICREEKWDERVIQEFADERVVVCGFGGALTHGMPDLYKTKYRVENLIRGGYRSCVDDAEVHGDRFTGSCNIVFADGFFLAIRRSFLDRIGGWSFLINNRIDFIGYDMAICALARRYGYKLRMVGVKAHHRGGGTSVGINVDRQTEYEYAHYWFFNEFRDVLPARVEP